MSRSRGALAALVLVAGAAGAEEERRGPVTNQPLPRFVSLSVDRANVRRGPDVEHRIDWVFLRRGEPLEVVAEHGPWRRVRDVDAAEGWVHHAMLRPARTALVIAAPEAAMRRDPQPDGAMVARLETGVTGRLEACEPAWCRLEAGGFEGWVAKADLWGVRAAEVFD